MTDAAPTPNPFRALWVVLVCTLIAVLEGYDIQAIGVAAPTLAPALRLGQNQIGLAGSMAMVGLVFGALLGGWAADRIGRKPVLIASVAWFGVFSLVTAAAPGLDMLLVSRLLTGIGFGGAMPLLITIAAEVSAPSRRVSTITSVFVGMPVGGSIAALIARFLPPEFDWRLIFVIGGVAPLLIAPLAAVLLPETAARREGRVNARLLSVLFGEGRALATVLLWVPFVATQLVLSIMLAWLPLLVVGKGLSRDTGFVSSLSFNLVGIVGCLVVGRAVDRLGPRLPLLAALVGLAFAVALLAMAQGSTLVVAFAGLVGFGVVGAQFSLYAIAPRFYPAAVRATGAGAAVGVGRMGSIVGPLLAGALRAGHASVTQTLACTLPAIALGAACVLVLTHKARTFAD